MSPGPGSRDAHAEAVAYVEGLDLLGMRFGLERMVRLLAVLGDPHRGRPAVQIVGTNGKSSTARLTAAALASTGRRVGTYLSPHVTGWHERIEVDGAPVGPGEFAAAVARVRAAAARVDSGPQDRVTQFEVLTAAAFCVFAHAAVDVAVIEAGLGGRYDATNVIDGGAVTVLTNVSLEHTALLGDTVTAIAGEKLAVAPDGARTLVVGHRDPATTGEVEAVMTARRLSGWWIGRDFDAAAADGGTVTVTCPGARYEDLPLALRGGFQHDNLAVAVAAAQRLTGEPLDVGALRGAVAAVRAPGRLEVFPGNPVVAIDGAHNPAGMAALAESLPSVLGGRRPVAVVSLLDDKDVAGMVAVLAPRCRALVATRSAHRRAADPALIRDAACAAGLDAVVECDPVRALADARRRAGPDGAVLICGSLYLLADLRERLAVTPAE